MAVIKKKREVKYTEKDVQKILAKFFVRKVFVCNSRIFGDGEVDFANITNGFIDEYEIKCRYDDFKRDFVDKKEKHEKLLSGESKNSQFTFVFNSKKLAEKCLPDIPEEYGVWYICPSCSNPQMIRTAEVLSKEKILSQKDILRKLSQAYRNTIIKGK